MELFSINIDIRAMACTMVRQPTSIVPSTLRAGMTSKTCIGLVSDTHGVFDEDVIIHFKRVARIIHAGDIGHHGGAEAIIALLSEKAPVTAVRGNVDEGTAYPESATLQVNGWQILLTHICGIPPKVTPTGAALVACHSPDIVVCGHSHVYGCEEEGGTLFINPGSAGPARFKLGRSVALLELPPKGCGEKPVVHKIELRRKAPPRLAMASAPGKKQQRKD